MELNLTPVEVNITVETPSLEREAFYNICFITENYVSPRTIEVYNLAGLLDNGYTRDDLAYNFCVGVFSQQGISSVFIRAKRYDESYESAFLADDNSKYYFIAIESKDEETISDFNIFINKQDDYKLQFTSSGENPFTNKKLVHYYQDIDGIEEDISKKSPDYYLNKAYKNTEVTFNWSGAPQPMFTENEDVATVDYHPLDMWLIEMWREEWVSEDYLTPDYLPLDIDLIEMWREEFVSEDILNTSIVPINITLAEMWKDVSVSDELEDVLTSSIVPLDITMVDMFPKYSEDNSDGDVIQTSVTPLDITLKKIII